MIWNGGPDMSEETNIVRQAVATDIKSKSKKKVKVSL
jgi:hypothetical protein